MTFWLRSASERKRREALSTSIPPAPGLPLAVANLEAKQDIPMNLFDLARQGWKAAEAFIDGLVQSAAHSPELIALVAAVEGQVKQDASNAVAVADTGFIAAATVLAGAAEAALDTAYKAYIGPFAPIASVASHDTIDKVRDAAIAQANLWALKAKAALAPPAQSQVQS